MQTKTILLVSYIRFALHVIWSFSENFSFSFESQIKNEKKTVETLMHFSEPKYVRVGVLLPPLVFVSLTLFICEISVFLPFDTFYFSALVFVWPYSFMCAGHGALVALHLRKSENSAEIKRLYFMAIRMLAALFAPLFGLCFFSRFRRRWFLVARCQPHFSSGPGK